MPKTEIMVARDHISNRLCNVRHSDLPLLPLHNHLLCIPFFASLGWSEQDPLPLLLIFF